MTREDLSQTGESRHSVLVLQHEEDVPPGRLDDAFRAAGVEVETVSLHRGEGLPSPAHWSGIVVLGGSMGAYEEEAYAFLGPEKRMLAEATALGVPVLGICLGCQVLADTLGGRAFRATEPEVAVSTVRLTAAGKEDPVVASLDSPVLVWHQDSWEPPPGATLLAETERHPQAFRLGSALGIQPHPEATVDIARSWAEHPEGAAIAEAAGVRPDELISVLSALEEPIGEMAGRLFAAWLEGLPPRDRRPGS